MPLYSSVSSSVGCSFWSHVSDDIECSGCSFCAVNSATPQLKKEKALHHSVKREGAKLHYSERRKAWGHEFHNKINRFWEDIEVDGFIDTLVPSSLPVPERDCTHAFDGVTNSATERAVYDPLVAGLNSLVSDFPGHKKLYMINNNKTEVKFPYAGFSDSAEYPTKPDIISFMPGDTSTHGAPRWREVSLAIEVKPTSAEDPIREPFSDKKLDTMTQLILNARNMLISRMALYVYVIGVYGHEARIYRVDRASAVYSPSFNYVDNPQLLRQFLWHFVNPVVPGISIHGSDPTVSIPTALEIKEAKRLMHLGEDKQDEYLDNAALWIKGDVKDDDGVTRQRRFLTTKLIWLNTCLFSRASTVWDVAFLDSFCGEVEEYVIKDSWRQLMRGSELDYYEHLERELKAVDMKPFGIAELKAGWDLGKQEFVKRVGLDPNVLKQRFSAFTRSDTLSSSSDVEEGAKLAEKKEFEQLLTDVLTTCSNMDGHCTLSSIIRGACKANFNDRSHMRLLMKSRGRRLSKFHETRWLARVFRDAIKGHKLALEMGLLHRDISEGNVMMFDDDRKEDSAAGFICDFDYSAILRPAGRQAHMNNSTRKNSAAPLTDQRGEFHGEDAHYNDDDNLRERTGTIYFMAQEILQRKDVVHRPHHDLQSFYWLLVWIIYRHTQFVHPRYPDCWSLFGGPTERILIDTRTGFLFEGESLVVQDNEPMSYIVQEFTKLVGDAHWYRQGKPFTHDEVLKIFDDALKMDGWPKGDKALPFTSAAGFVQTGHTESGQMMVQTESKHLRASAQSVLSSKAPNSRQFATKRQRGAEDDSGARPQKKRK